MDRRPASDLYTLGGLFKEIELCHSDKSNIELYTLISRLLYQISDYTDLIVEEDMGRNSSFLSVFTNLNNAAEEYPNDIVKRQMVDELKIEFRRIEDNLINNLSLKTIAFPESEHINIQFLIWEPWNLFSDSKILDKIPKSIQEDLIHFCQCYAYGLYTSAIIHILKATENYNIHFYEKISKEKDLKSLTWGALITKTEIKLDELDSKNIGFKKLKASLENLKNNNRIKIIHKNKIINNENEAHEIFEECRLVISKMYYILKDSGFVKEPSF